MFKFRHFRKLELVSLLGEVITEYFFLALDCLSIVEGHAESVKNVGIFGHGPLCFAGSVVGVRFLDHIKSKCDF